MKITDKVIAAFLVSAGLFSSAHAMQYVGAMSVKEKKALVSVALQATDGEVTPSVGGDVPGTNDQNK